MGYTVYKTHDELGGRYPGRGLSVGTSPDVIGAHRLRDQHGPRAYILAHEASKHHPAGSTYYESEGWIHPEGE